MLRSALITAVIAGGASLANAGLIHVSGIGGGFDLASASVPAFGPAPGLDAGALAVLHAQLNGAGVATDGRITFAAVDTDTGLAMVALIDSVLAPAGAPGLAGIHFDGVSDSDSLDHSTDPLLILPSGSTRIAFGDFAWNSNGEGDAFAWSNLRTGTAMSWRFQLTGPSGLSDPAFQFVTFGPGGWQAIALPADQTGFSPSGEYGFGAVVVPSPAAPALLGAAGLLAIRRRRR
jgi:hypothetical protein